MGDGFAGSVNLDDIPGYLEGVHLDGRMVVVYSQQNYRDFWYRRPERTGVENSDKEASFMQMEVRHRPSSEPAIRVGINVVVYALTQEGSLARRYVQRAPDRRGGVSVVPSARPPVAP